MLRWSHHVDIFGTLHFIVRCLADRSEGPLPPCSCRRRRCSCTPPASASSPTSAKDIEWSPAREEPMGPLFLSPRAARQAPGDDERVAIPPPGLRPEGVTYIIVIIIVLRNCPCRTSRSTSSGLQHYLSYAMNSNTCGEQYLAAD